MVSRATADDVDGRLFKALTDDPRAAAITLADRAQISRNTAQARLNRWDEADALRSFERRIDPEFLGYPLQAYVLTNVKQKRLDDVAAELAGIPEVLEVHGMSGVADLMIHVVAKDAGDLYRIAGQILGIKGVKRTNTALVMREMVSYRISPLIDGLATNR